MSWMNEHEITEALQMSAVEELPNMRRAAEVLSNLRDWTNQNSDGWPYWQKPSRAATKLQDMLGGARNAYYRGGIDADLTEAQLKAAFTPIKSFLTRQKVDHVEVFGP